MTKYQERADALKAFQTLPDDAKMRPREAAEYSQLRWGFGTERSFAKWRCLGGGPSFMKAGDAVVIYEKRAIDDWAKSKISAPVASTSHRAA